jgi:hypothetical protein
LLNYQPRNNENLCVVEIMSVAVSSLMYQVACVLPLSYSSKIFTISSARQAECKKIGSKSNNLSGSGSQTKMGSLAQKAFLAGFY